jgi:prephenate dehydrogenase
MMLDILLTNQENILAAIGLFRDGLDRLENLLAGGDPNTLAVLLDQAASKRHRLSAE